MYGIDLDTPLAEEQLDSLIDSIAAKIADRRLETPAVLLLEMHKPLGFVASQAVLVGMPFFAPFLGAQQIADFSKVLRDRENIERLITRIEDVAAARDAAKQGSSSERVSQADGGQQE